MSLALLLVPLCNDESGTYVSMNGACVEGMFIDDIRVYISLSHSLLLSLLPHPSPMHLCIVDIERTSPLDLLPCPFWISKPLSYQHGTVIRTFDHLLNLS